MIVVPRERDQVQERERETEQEAGTGRHVCAQERLADGKGGLVGTRERHVRERGMEAREGGRDWQVGGTRERGPAAKREGPACEGWTSGGGGAGERDQRARPVDERGTGVRGID